MTPPPNDQLARREILPSPPELRTTAREALFLDFDGTLVEIAPEPDAIQIAPALPALLAALDKRLEGRLAIVSGRSLADLDRYLGAIDIAMAGSHGGEFRSADGKVSEYLVPPVPPVAEEEMRRFAAGYEGLLVEIKPLGIAMHYRQAPDARDQVVSFATELAERLALKVKRGKMVVELLSSGCDKGSAVTKFMEMPAFQQTRPIFVGDDITDEDAFARVLDYSGGGILVGPERHTAALWRLPRVADVHAWLQAALT